MEEPDLHSVFVVVNHTRRELYVGAGPLSVEWFDEVAREHRLHLAWEDLCLADRDTVGHWDFSMDRTKLIGSQPVSGAHDAARLALRLRADRTALTHHCARVAQLTADGYVVLAAPVN